ncbi:ABC transporter permease [Lewinella sp. 4G2]|uniref:cell division protein FtsX n=1 Tax=Lewinella sp. 4G2 TaxID=1803372 RepID=UPI0007B47C22|nr:hypothetical protein [Lewinella sp. 4G2]OAV46023.1 hypothetical protein A3850_017270 [Lewinella sp. 4G2]
MHAPNKIYVTLSLGLSLFLLGIVAFWAWQAHDLTQRLRQQMQMVVELEPDYQEFQLKGLLTSLTTAPYASLESPPRFESKDVGIRELDPELAKDLGDLGINNPLLDIVAFTVPLEYLQEDSLRAIVAEVQLLPGVLAVHYPSGLAEELADNARKVTLGLLALAVLFLLITALLIHNTVRLSLSANRLLIKTQELVGASWGFISRPYLWRGLWQGAVAGLLAAGGLVATWFGIDGLLPELGLTRNVEPIAIVAAALVALGMLISFLSYYVGVRRYLRLPIDELY